jgi:hypothetical protein
MRNDSQSSFDGIVIAPCGAKKKDRPCQAKEMYTGSYHKVCLEYARSLVPDNRIYILSALYGLVNLDQWIKPYNTKMNERRAITTQELQRQAEAKRITDYPVIALGGKLYTDKIKAVWPNAQTPLRGKGGMGKQMQWMKKEIEK